ncbi:radical SAM protein [Xylophilus sp. GW821-FHT01B05]
METGYSLKTIRKALTTRALELTIFPTEQCNFRCTYCYEDFSIGKMKPDVVRGIKNLIDHRVSELDHLRLVWFGGEPLAALDIIEDIATYAKNSCIGKKVNFAQGHITTNGYKLNLKTASRLVELGQSDFQISLDGDEKTHNRSRPLLSGGGTYGVIMRNIRELHASDLPFSITLRLHLMPTNLSGIESLLSELQTIIGGDSRFKIFLKRISNYGGPNAESIKTLDYKDSEERVKRLTDNIAGNGGLSPISTHSEYICYAAKPNSLLIRANGRIAKCTVALNESFNDIGEIHPDGSLSLDNSKLRPWMRGFSTLSQLDLACPLTQFPGKEKIINFVPAKALD